MLYFQAEVIIMNGSLYPRKNTKLNTDMCVVLWLCLRVCGDAVSRNMKEMFTRLEAFSVQDVFFLSDYLVTVVTVHKLM